MIFAHTLDKVLSAEKCQTRRLIKNNEKLCSESGLFGEQIFVKATSSRKVYEVGKSYAVQPNRGKSAVARIVITGIRREPVRAITEQDAHAEGFASRDEFIATWRIIHGQKASLNRHVWVIEFELQCIISDDFRALYERRLSTSQSFDHRHDLSAPLEGVPGTGLHRWDH
jgi:hypothetical protein